jgi:hypothetical protein
MHSDDLLRAVFVAFAISSARLDFDRWAVAPFGGDERSARHWTRWWVRRWRRAWPSDFPGASSTRTEVRFRRLVRRLPPPTTCRFRWWAMRSSCTRLATSRYVPWVCPRSAFHRLCDQLRAIRIDGKISRLNSGSGKATREAACQCMNVQLLGEVIVEAPGIEDGAAIRPKAIVH